MLERKVTSNVPCDGAQALKPARVSLQLSVPRQFPHKELVPPQARVHFRDITGPRRGPSACAKAPVLVHAQTCNPPISTDPSNDKSCSERKIENNRMSKYRKHPAYSRVEDVIELHHKEAVTRKEAATIIRADHKAIYSCKAVMQELTSMSLTYRLKFGSWS